jgi:hypothetical protein
VSGSWWQERAAREAIRAGAASGKRLSFEAVESLEYIDAVFTEVGTLLRLREWKSLDKRERPV